MAEWPNVGTTCDYFYLSIPDQIMTLKFYISQELVPSSPELKYILHVWARGNMVNLEFVDSPGNALTVGVNDNNTVKTLLSNRVPDQFPSPEADPLTLRLPRWGHIARKRSKVCSGPTSRRCLAATFSVDRMVKAASASFRSPFRAGRDDGPLVAPTRTA